MALFLRDLKTMLQSKWWAFLWHFLQQNAINLVSKIPGGKCFPSFLFVWNATKSSIFSLTLWTSAPAVSHRISKILLPAGIAIQGISNILPVLAHCDQETELKQNRPCDILRYNCFCWQQSVSAPLLPTVAVGWSVQIFFGLLWRTYCKDRVQLYPPDLSGRMRTPSQLLWDILPHFQCIKT